jgi:SAM-dependent methyltransferase
MNEKNQMEEEWNERARTNPYHYVSPFVDKWDKKSFYHWGEIEYQKAIEPILTSLRFRRKSKSSVLEIGCGPGRISRALSKRFGHVSAFDVSDAYIAQAREENKDCKNITFEKNDGMHFPEIADNSIDFVFSGWVFMHMPTNEVVWENLKDFTRTLKVNGAYLVDFPAFKEKIDLSSIRSKMRMVPLGGDRMKSSETWVGALLDKEELYSRLRALNLTVDEREIIDPQSRVKGLGKWGQLVAKDQVKTWFYGRRATTE